MLSYYLSYAVLAICLIYPLIILLFFIIQKSKLDLESIQNRFGSLYEGIRTDSFLPLSLNIIFLLKRLAFIATCLYLYNLPSLQIQISVQMQVLSIIFIGMVRPYESSKQNNLEIMNEACILLIMDHLFVFTDFVEDLEYQYALGYSIISITALNILINMGIIFKEGAISLKEGIPKLKKMILNCFYLLTRRKVRKDIYDESSKNKADQSKLFQRVQQMQKEGLKPNKIQKKYEAKSIGQLGQFLALENIGDSQIQEHQINQSGMEPVTILSKAQSKTAQPVVSFTVSVKRTNETRPVTQDKSENIEFQDQSMNEQESFSGMNSSFLFEQRLNSQAYGSNAQQMRKEMQNKMIQNALGKRQFKQ